MIITNIFFHIDNVSKKLSLDDEIIRCNTYTFSSEPDLSFSDFTFIWIFKSIFLLNISIFSKKLYGDFIFRCSLEKNYFMFKCPSPPCKYQYCKSKPHSMHLHIRYYYKYDAFLYSILFQFQGWWCCDARLAEILLLCHFILINTYVIFWSSLFLCACVLVYTC